MLCALIATQLSAQNNEFVLWDAQTNSVSTEGPFTVLQSSGTDHWPGSNGDLQGLTVLPMQAPISNVFPGTEYLHPTVANQLMDLGTYPARTGVKVIGYTGSTPWELQSGVLVGNKYVLTAGHGIVDLNNPGHIYYDSILVAPAFDNGLPHNALPTAISVKYHVPASYFYDLDPLADLCLLELEQPIGEQVGWVGLAYNTDMTFFQERNFHRFSWPRQGFSGFDFNGDTMIYSYGRVQSAQHYLVSSGTLAFPGESGGAWTTVQDGQHLCYGITQESTDSRHLRFSPALFYALREITGQSMATSIQEGLDGKPYNIWPRPAVDHAYISNMGNIQELSATDLQGRSVALPWQQMGSQVQLDLSGLPAGVLVLNWRTPEGAFADTLIKR